MKRGVVLLIVVSLLLPTLAFAGKYKQRTGQSLYLAHGVWVSAKKGNQKCINYKTGTLLPAGTAVIKARIHIMDDEEGYSSGTANKMSFKVKETGQKVTIRFEKKWHPGKSIKDYYKMMFTDKSLDELTAGMTADEIEAIKGGYILEGMSKKAVLVAFGPPPEHVTKSLASNQWMYWDNKFKKHKICFDGEEKAVECPAMKRL